MNEIIHNAHMRQYNSVMTLSVLSLFQVKNLIYDGQHKIFLLNC